MEIVCTDLAHAVSGGYTLSNVSIRRMDAHCRTCGPRTIEGPAIAGGLGPAVSITSAAARIGKDERQRTFRGVWDSGDVTSPCKKFRPGKCFHFSGPGFSFSNELFDRHNSVENCRTESIVGRTLSFNYEVILCDTILFYEELLHIVYTLL